MCYCLTNKDKLLLTFSCIQNEYDELSLSENKWFSSVKPIGYTNIDSFDDRRKAPKHRKHIQELLERYGCEDITGFLKISDEIRQDLKNLSDFVNSQIRTILL